ncbi:AraC family transcriptional regulator [Bremerella sp. JC770]|uniref:AraC family transcriptional regulator n=1 Tax=Bremerella sp. JC770 TaxID=3232137 RepID=UPI003458D991
MELQSTLKASYALKTKADACQRWQGLPGSVRDRFIAVDHVKNSDDGWDIYEVLVQESIGPVPVANSQKDEYYLSLLLNSDASQPLELDLGYGSFFRPNQPGLITFAEPQKVQSIKGRGPFHSVGYYVDRSIFHRRVYDLLDHDDVDLDPLFARVISDRSLDILLRRLLLEARDGEHFDRESILDSVCVRLLNLAGLKLPELGDNDHLPPPSISRVLEYIDAHIGEDLGRRTLADIAGVSPPYFSRLFFRSLRQTPQEYIRTQRLEKARQILLAGTDDLPIAQIAVQCGFSDRSHLAREFRRNFGLSPGEYRRGY